MQNRRTKQEQRVLAHYALQEGGKALEEGLMQNSKFKIQLLFVINKTLCKPTTHRFIVELQAGVRKRNVESKYHYDDRPSLAQRVELVLYQPSVEEVHHWIVYNVERIGYIAQELAKCRRNFARCFARGGKPYDCRKH